MLRLLLCLLALTPLKAAPACAACHPAEVARHAATRHARALRPAAASEFAAALPGSPLGEARGGYLLSYTPNGRGFTVRAQRGAELAEGRIDWVLGAGDQGITPVVSTAGRWLEHRISYYARPAKFDLTLGHAPGASRSPVAALGVPQSPETIRSCFQCHARLAPGPGIAIVEPGVTCDRCHTGADAHAASRAPVSTPAKLAPLAQVELCAACHRLTPPSPANDPLNIRFQPLRLVKSRCFTVGNITCGNCHNAHENAVRQDLAYYRAKCQSCHTNAHARAASDCLGCHMPKSSPAPYLEFTDHYIRRQK